MPRIEADMAVDRLPPAHRNLALRLRDAVVAEILKSDARDDVIWSAVHVYSAAGLSFTVRLRGPATWKRPSGGSSPAI